MHLAEIVLLATIEAIVLALEATLAAAAPTGEVLLLDLLTETGPLEVLLVELAPLHHLDVAVAAALDQEVLAVDREAVIHVLLDLPLEALVVVTVLREVLLEAPEALDLQVVAEVAAVEAVVAEAAEASVKNQTNS